eukprot:Awhi_evm1s5714
MSTSNDNFMKLVCLSAMVFFNVSLIITMKHTKNDTIPYNSKTVVLFSELLKMVASFFFLYYEHDHFSDFQKVVREVVFGKPREILKMAVPSTLYTIQSNLLFYGISQLDVATYQTLLQSKIFTTSFFSVTILKRSLSTNQHVALFLLFIGISFVQVSQMGRTQKTGDDGNLMFGSAAILLASVSSGFAGIFFEKVLKGHATSIWVRNIHLGFFGTLSSVVSLLSDFESIQSEGLIHGYTNYVVLAIALYAINGLLVALVVKYADNILKCFASAIAVVLSVICSIYMFNFTATPSFFAGLIFIILSVVLFSTPTDRYTTISKDR